MSFSEYTIGFLRSHLLSSAYSLLLEAEDQMDCSSREIMAPGCAIVSISLLCKCKCKVSCLSLPSRLLLRCGPDATGVEKGGGGEMM